MPLTENFRFYVCIRFLIEPMGHVAQGLRAFNAEDSCHHGVMCAGLGSASSRTYIERLYRTYARRAGARAARAPDVPSGATSAALILFQSSQAGPGRIGPAHSPMTLDWPNDRRRTLAEGSQAILV